MKNISPLKIMVIMGTRPEAIKLAPIIRLARENSKLFDPIVVSTGQHREILDQMLTIFEIDVDHDLRIMQHDQSLAEVTSLAINRLNPIISSEKPDIVVVQGDTTSTFAGALTAFYNKVPVAHIEAGLRTFDKKEPFPEEVNRCLTSQLAEFHFTPTQVSADNLLNEGIKSEKIWVTGNTCIDSLLWLLKQKSIKPNSETETRKILLTTHRRENQGKPMQSICEAILRLVDEFPDLTVTYPVHPSPGVRSIVFPMLSSNPKIDLIEPVDYEQFVTLLNDSHIILTDSGGVQEEAPSLGKPVLVLRDKTERPEGVDAGTLRLVGADSKKIYSEVRNLLLDHDAYENMSKVRNPYGDGKSASRILDVLIDKLYFKTNGRKSNSGIPKTLTDSGSFVQRANSQIQ